mgnify:FL=1
MSFLILNNSNGTTTAQNKFYNDLLEGQKLTDVTLACDGFQIGVHRTIIAASSLFFREVILNSSTSNPFIYLRGVSQENLQALVKFIYIGETAIKTENVEDLLEIGNELKVLGLMGMEVDTKQESNDEKIIVNPDTKKLVEDISDQIMNTTPKVKHEQGKVILLGQLPVTHEQDSDKDTNLLDLSVEIDKRLSSRIDERGHMFHICTQCGKENTRKHALKSHIETHLVGFGFQHKCPFCGLSKSTTTAYTTTFATSTESLSHSSFES